MQRVFPVERRVVKALRPVLTRAAGVPMPEDSVFDAVERLHAELDEVRDLLSGPDASVRLVLTPEAVVLAEARRSYTTLSLFGYRVDGVVANRVFPAEGADDWRAGWVIAQDAVLAEVAAVVRRAAALALGVPRRRAGRRRRARELAAERVRRRPTRSRRRRRRPVRGARAARGGAVLRLRLPFVTRDRGRPRPQRRRAGGHRGVVPSAAHAAGGAGPATGSRARGSSEGVLQVWFEDVVTTGPVSERAG